MARNQPLTEQRPTSRNLGVLRRLAGYLRPYRATLAAALLALVIAAGAVLGFGRVLQRVVDHGLSHGSSAELNQALFLFLMVVTIMAASVAARVYLVTWIGERVVADMRKAVFAQVLKLDPTFFEITRTGEVISRLTTDTSLLQVVVGSTLAIAVRNALLFAGGLVMLALTSAKLALLVLLGVPLVVVPLWLLGYKVRKWSRRSQDRIADISAFIDEVLYGIRTVQAYCHEAIDSVRYGERVEAAFETAIQRTRVSALLTGLVMLLTSSAISVVLWVGGHDVIAGKISGGQLSAFVFYAVLVASSVGALSEVAGELLRAAGAAERLLENTGHPATHRRATCPCASIAAGAWRSSAAGGELPLSVATRHRGVERTHPDPAPGREGRTGGAIRSGQDHGVAAAAAFLRSDRGYDTLRRRRSAPPRSP